MDLPFDLYAWAPYIFATIATSIVAFFILNYIRTRKLPPTDEPVVGEYHIEVDVGTHIIPFEGTLYYFNKLLNPRYLHTFAKILSKKKTPTNAQLKKFKSFLKEKAFLYAMRQGTKKLAFIALQHPIETTPYFKTEEGTGRKIVHATGTIGNETKGFQHVTMEPINLSDYTLNPKDYDVLNNLGEMLRTLYEKAPLMQELEAEKEKNRVMQSKVNGMADEVGRLKDEVEYWKYEAKRKGIEKAEETRIRIPDWLRKIVPYAILFAIGYVVSPTIPQLSDYHPVFLAAGLTILGFIIKKLLL